MAIDLSKQDPNNPYIVEPQLEEAVRFAIQLKRPLLIQGEPGSGKTKLAKHIAYAMYGKDYPQYFFEWHIKSTSKARDGLYTFNHTKRLHDVQLKKYKQEDLKYLRLGPMGKAFETTKPAVVLIDEIDKADIDFPNDLLHELEQYWFDVPEVEVLDPKGEASTHKVEAIHKPLVVITSNNEKPLPNAFLRRCLYYHLKFPDLDRLTLILQSHFKDEDTSRLKMVAHRFDELRTSLRSPQQKNLSTSELLDWFKALSLEWEENEAQLRDPKELPARSTLLKGFEIIARWEQVRNTN